MKTHGTTACVWLAGCLLGAGTLSATLSCSSADGSEEAPPRGGSGAGAGAGTGTAGTVNPGGGTGGSLMFGDVEAGGSGSGDPTEDDNCGLVPYLLDQRPSPVLLLQDRSTSMRGDVDNAPGTRWENLKTAVSQVVTETQASVAWGMKFFPNEMTCQVSPGAEFAPTFNNAAPIVGALNAIPGDSEGTGLTDGTPTRKALEAATAYLTTLEGNKYIVLATDGQPTCRGDSETSDDYEAALEAARATAAAGIKIAVVGIAFDPVEPGEAVEDEQQFLNDVADIGGMARSDPSDPQTHYYPASNTAELVAAFAAITSQVVSCTFELPQVPPVPDNVVVKLNGVKVPQEPTNGWQYDAGMKSVTLHGSACTNATSTVTPLDVKIVMGCPGQIVE